MISTQFQADRVAEHIIEWLKLYAAQSGQNGWVIGVSGGIDSAVTSALCARTGLPTRVVELPIHQHPDQVSRARLHMDGLVADFSHVRMESVDLTAAYEAFRLALPQQQEDASAGLALANARARLRMTALYALAAQHRALVVGTGNKVEDFGVGFYTKYGDGGVDLSPIADLMKTEVFALGAYLGVPMAIQQAAPTDGLWGDDRTDEMQIGASYPELEWAMGHVEGDSGQWSPREVQVMAIYQRMHRANQHKMRPIPVCIVPDSTRFAAT
ncbi:MAG: NAD(+) synthase [Bacteroidetes bacterium]|jgi:NAD+ synthase|nr:NAD(+) synthase [Bacteroidota bacterium]